MPRLSFRVLGFLFCITASVPSSPQIQPYRCRPPWLTNHSLPTIHLHILLAATFLSWPVYSSTSIRHCWGNGPDFYLMLFLFVCGHRFSSSFPFDFPRVMRILVTSFALPRYKYSCGTPNQLHPSVSVTPRAHYPPSHSLRLSSSYLDSPSRPRSVASG